MTRCSPGFRVGAFFRLQAPLWMRWTRRIALAARCTACGSELILTSVAPHETVSVRGVEHHTFVLKTNGRLCDIRDFPCAKASGVPLGGATREGMAT